MSSSEIRSVRDHQAFERAIIRIRNAGGETVGTGFLISHDLVCTCAHVVALAAGTDPRSPEAPAAVVSIDFPLLDGVTAAITARVMVWVPIQDNETGDVAVLRLDSDPPDRAQLAHVASDDGTWDERIRAIGFSDGHNAGIWVTGQLRGRQATGWMQIEVSDGPQISSGFSGAPVWGEAADGVVGLVVAAERGATTAYMVPMSAIFALDQRIIAAAMPECPYRGLQPFGEQDAAVFHGRGREATRLAEHVEHHSLVVVSGGSGCGKSSLVRASLWPRLRAEGATLVEVRPALPFTPRELLRDTLLPIFGPDWADQLMNEQVQRLSPLIAAKHDRLVLFIDQFEEVAAADPEVARELFELINRLVRSVPAAPGRPPSLQAIFTMRSAAIDEVLTAEFADVVEQSSVHVLPMSHDNLHAAVTEPVRSAGLVAFEEGLAEQIVREALDAPGQLPLVEFALTRLWEESHRRRTRVLTHSAYNDIGRVAGALAEYAEDVYTHRLNAAQQDLAKLLLVRLVRPTEAGSFTMAPARLDQLGPQLSDIARRLSSERLVVVRQDQPGQPEVVALTHEALIHEWDRLHGWLVDDRGFLTWREQLRTSMTGWRNRPRDSGTLLRGGALATAEDWLSDRQGQLTDDERRYIAAGRNHQRRGFRIWVSVTAVITVLLLLATGLAAATFDVNRKLAAQLRRQAALALAQESLQRANTDPITSLQLAQAAWQHNPASPDAQSALLLQHARYGSVKSIRTNLWRRPLVTAVTDADGSVVAVAENDGTVTIWTGLLGGAPRSWRVTSSPGLRGLELSRDGRHLAVFSQRSGITIWNVAGRSGPVQLRAPAPAPEPTPTQVVASQFSADGSRLVVSLSPHHDITGGDPEELAVYDTRIARQIPTGIAAADGVVDMRIHRVDPGGATVWLSEFTERGDRHNVIRNVASGEVVRRLPDGLITDSGTIIECRTVRTVRNSLANSHGELVVRDGITRARRFRVNIPESCPVDNFVDSTGTYAVVANGRNLPENVPFQLSHLVDLKTGRAYQLQASHVSDSLVPSGRLNIATVTPGPAGPELTSISASGVIRFKPATPKDDLAQFRGLSTTELEMAWSSDARLVAAHTDTDETTDEHAGVEVFQLPSQRRVAGGPGTALADLKLGLVPSLTFTPDSKYLLARSSDDELIVLSAPDFAVRRRIPLPIPTQVGSPRARQGWSLSVIPLGTDEVAVLYAGAFTRWRISSGEQTGEILPLHADPTRLRDAAQRSWAAGRPDHPGQILVSRPDGAELWNLNDRRAIRSFIPEPNVRMAGAHISSSSIAVHTATAQLELWNPDRNGAARARIPLPNDLEVVDFAPGGILVVKTLGGELQFWDISLGRSIAQLQPPGLTHTWHMAGDTLIGLSRDGQLAIDLNRTHWLSNLCAANDRDYTASEQKLLRDGAETTPPCHIHD